MIVLWHYGPNLGLGQPPWNSPFHFDLQDLRQSVELLGRLISSSQGFYLYTNTEKRPHTNTKHPCPEWDSNQRSRLPSEQTVHALDRFATVTDNLWLYINSTCRLPCVFAVNFRVTVPGSYGYRPLHFPACWAGEKISKSVHMHYRKSYPNHPSPCHAARLGLILSALQTLRIGLMQERNVVI
jgi:hypothetical protein